MGPADVDAPESDVEAGTGEEDVVLELFLRFSIAASMLSRSAMSKMRANWFGLKGGPYILLKGTVTLANWARRTLWIKESAFRKWDCDRLTSRHVSVTRLNASMGCMCGGGIICK